MGSNSFLNIMNDFMRAMVETYGSEDCITEIKVSPYIFNKMEVENGWTPDGSGSKYADIYTQQGKVKVIKDLTEIINNKQNQVDELLKEIEELKYES